MTDPASSNLKTNPAGGQTVTATPAASAAQSAVPAAGPVTVSAAAKTVTSGEAQPNPAGAAGAPPPSPKDGVLVAKGQNEIFLLPRMANRHGMVAGATGTGKTVSIHSVAERFSEIGVPVFLADVKGDLAGNQPGRRRQRQGHGASSAARSTEFRVPARFRSCSGTCMASRATRCARPFRRWDRCCLGGCSV